ncbi:uncharacterized protein LTR77_010496 [Saxophila tyrrhenica]|uniref:Uncharacterized protein n=1 Tax=Saxophila tyrrhenica TaxID=1690608 RepID=A0AAV9NVV9_9PEZI|nr:hypothetical protein LTR77_010496 [Saxophila tyrrhenica]
MFYGGTVFATGWVVRTVSTHYAQSLGLYIAQIVMILAGPPIYAAAEYNVLGRLMHYLPMHALLNPSRVFVFYIVLGVTVETLTGIGAGQAVPAQPGTSRYVVGGTLMAVALLLQACIEMSFITMVAIIHRRCVRSGMLTSNIRTVCYTLYGTSFLILARCIFRAVETFLSYGPQCEQYHCGPIANNEWFLYVFEAAPMVLYTYWLNFFHPGRFLPIEHRRFLDPDGQTERMGPGWIDDRTRSQRLLDPFDFKGARSGRSEQAMFWLRPEEWPTCQDGCFALGTATNIGKSARLGKQKNEKASAIQSEPA